MDIKKNLKGWLAGRKQKDEAAEASVPVAAVQPAAPEAPEPDVAAVIAAVIAIEVKMFMAIQGRSFTFNQGGQPQGWSDWGRLLIHPYQGVR